MTSIYLVYLCILLSAFMSFGLSLVCFGHYVGNHVDNAYILKFANRVLLGMAGTTVGLFFHILMGWTESVSAFWLYLLSMSAVALGGVYLFATLRTSGHTRR